MVFQCRTLRPQQLHFFLVVIQLLQCGFRPTLQTNQYYRGIVFTSMALTLFLMAGLPPCISSETAVFFIYKLSINFKVISHPSQVRIRWHHIRRLLSLPRLLLTASRLPHLSHLLECVLRHLSGLRSKHSLVPMSLQVIHCLLLP